MSLSISFLGAARTVTGSRYLVRSDAGSVLVDCGLFQGPAELRRRNRGDLGFDPRALDAVVLTHAHMDHTGLLPRLCALGFEGPVFCTAGTRDLLGVLLPDSARIQEEDARRHREPTGPEGPYPLYTVADVHAALSLLQPRAFHETFALALGIDGRFSRAGHILGAASFTLRAEELTIAFSGDVGRPDDPVMRPPEPLAEADYLIVESTYGDRRHAVESVFDALERVVVETAARGGALLIPAFAIGRAQHIMHVLAELTDARRVPDLPVFLDSPMAINATKIFCDHPDDHRLSPSQCEAACGVAQYTRTPEESKTISRRPGPKIILAASGMATGGRVVHHLKHLLPDHRNTVLFAGFQAPGTRGHELVHGAGEVEIHDEWLPVRARVERLEGLSAHGDYAELLDWLAQSEVSPCRVFVTHGEDHAAEAFRGRLEDAFGWDVEVPSTGALVALG